MNSDTLIINTPFIVLNAALKYHWNFSGGEANQLILDGHIKVNDTTAHEKRKKCYPNDTITFNGSTCKIQSTLSDD